MKLTLLAVTFAATALPLAAAPPSLPPAAAAATSPAAPESFSAQDFALVLEALNTLQSDSDLEGKARLQLVRDLLRAGDLSAAAEQCPQVGDYRTGMAWGEVAISAAVSGQAEIASNALTMAARTWPLHGEWRASRIAARLARAYHLMDLTTNAQMWEARVTETEDKGLASNLGGLTTAWGTAFGESVRGARAQDAGEKKTHYVRMAEAAGAWDVVDDGELSLAAARQLLNVGDQAGARTVARRVEPRVRALSSLADWKLSRLCALAVIYAGCGEQSQANTLVKLAEPLPDAVDAWMRPGALAWLAVAQAAAGRQPDADKTWNLALTAAREQPHPRARAMAVLDALAAARFANSSLPPQSRPAWAALVRDSTVGAR
jgi:hypothetical protein